jgi:hypothetical protein
MIFFFLLSACASAQILINAGGPATGSYSADPAGCVITGGSAYGPAQQPDLRNQAGVYQTLRYGTAFSYDCPALIGSCTLKIDLLENRPAVASPSVPAAGPGLRLFTVTANGISSGLIDIFAIAGAQTPYVFPMPTIPVTDGHLRIQFTASKGNASVSGIEASCAPPPPVPGPPGPAGPQGIPGQDGKDGFVRMLVSPAQIVCVVPLSCPVDPADPMKITIKLLAP